MIWLQISTRGDFDLREEFVKRLSQNVKKLPKSKRPRMINNFGTKGKFVVFHTGGGQAANNEMQWESSKLGSTRAVIRAVRKGGMEIFFLGAVLQRLHDNFRDEIRNISIQFESED
jgi:hypothetical protein